MGWRKGEGEGQGERNRKETTSSPLWAASQKLARAREGRRECEIKFYSLTLDLLMKKFRLRMAQDYLLPESQPKSPRLAEIFIWAKER